MRKEAVYEQFGQNACGAVSCDGMMDCAFAKGNANVWETGPFPSQALRSERVECRRPSMDPWTMQSVKRVRVLSGRRENGGDVPWS